MAASESAGVGGMSSSGGGGSGGLSNSKPVVVKILVIGDHNTGKTSLVYRYVYKQFEEYTEATVGMDIASKHVRVDDLTLKVQLWDIAGQDRFIGLAPTYYRHAVAAVVVFDITNALSLQNAKKWKNDVDEKVFLKNGDHIPVVLFANKWDIVDMNARMRKVSDEELETFCRENNFIGWFSTSAKTGLNVRRGMNYMITTIIENRKKMESTFHPNHAVGANSSDRNKINIEDAANRPPDDDKCIQCGGISKSPRHSP